MENLFAKFTSYCYGYSKSESRVHQSLKQSKSRILHSSPLVVNASITIKAKCEYIMSHRIDTDSPEFSFRPKFSRAIQDLWAEQIIPALLENSLRLSVDDNAA